VEIDRKLRRFYALFLTRGPNINAIPDADLADLGMTRDEARALLSQPDFPWGEFEDELSPRSLRQARP
jgi:hypothetical protein